MSTIHKVALGTMAAAFAEARKEMPTLELLSVEEQAQAQADLEAKAREEAHAERLALGAPSDVNTLLSFMELLNGVPTAKRFVCWTLVNALNNNIIAQAQAHLRALRNETKEHEDPAFASMATEDRNRLIEAWNREKEETDRLVNEYAVREEQGFTPPMLPEEVLDRLVNLRELVAQPMIVASMGDKRNLPQSVMESIAFRLSEVPKADKAKCMRLHLLSGDTEEERIPLAEIVRIEYDSLMTDRKRLLADAGLIVEMAEKARWKGVTVEEGENIFDTLPAHVAFRLIGTVCRMLGKALDAETKAYLRFNRQSALAGRVIVKAALESYKKYFAWFEKKHGDELAAFEERGGMLKTLDDWLAPAA